MQRITHREFLTRLDDYKEEYNRPSRTDFYIMSLIYEVRYLLFKKRPALNLFKTFGIKFGTDKPKPKSKEQAAAISRGRWLGALGIRKKDYDGS